MRKPSPSITAETPSGSSTSPSSECRRSARNVRLGHCERREPSDDDRDRGRRRGVDDRVHDRLPRSGEEDARRSSECPVRLEAMSVADSQRSLDENREREPEEEREPAEARPTTSLSRVVRTGRSVSRSGRSVPWPRAAARAASRPTRPRPRRRAARARARLRRAGRTAGPPGCRSPPRSSRTAGRRG